MKHAAVLITSWLAVWLLLGCSDNQAAPRRLDAGSLGIITNWRAVKLPIHVRVDNTELRIWTTPKDSLSDSSASGHGVCQVSELRATAYDDNGRQLDDNLVTYSVTDATVAAIDARGFVTPKVSCEYDLAGHLVLVHKPVGVVATLNLTK